MARFEAKRDSSNGWRVVDTLTGQLHSARIADRDRARRQAETLNARLESNDTRSPFQRVIDDAVPEVDRADVARVARYRLNCVGGERPSAAARWAVGVYERGGLAAELEAIDRHVDEDHRRECWTRDCERCARIDARAREERSR